MRYGGIALGSVFDIAPQRGFMTFISHCAMLALMACATNAAQAVPYPAAPKPHPATHMLHVQDTAKGCALDDMNGASGDHIRLAVTFSGGNELESGTLFLSGLPDQMVLTAGAKINRVWAIPVAEARKTAIVASQSVNGQFTIRLQCIIAGRQFEDTAQLRIETTRIETTSALTAPFIPKVINQAEVLSAHPLMKQADELLTAGDIARARLLYEHLAMKGSPRAAFSLGRTFDPAYLSSVYVRGVVADVELAARWYRLADDLGVAEARGRLVALGK
jgi:hypothetical protein